MTDYERFKQLIEYFIAHYRYVGTESTDIPGYAKYIKPKLEANDFVITGCGWRGDNIQRMVDGLDHFDSLPDNYIQITIKKNFGYVTPRTCYLQINDADPAINVMLSVVSGEIKGVKISEYDYNGDGSWHDRDQYALEELGLYDDAAGITPALTNLFDNLITIFRNQTMTKKNDVALSRIDKYVKLLQHKKNIILQGAPGTGKTYSTAAIAVRICDDSFSDFADRDKVMEAYGKLIDNHQIEFITFHQSMDYEDFVEGLKPVPVKDADGNVAGIEYQVVGGIFKQICEEALDNLMAQEESPQKADYDTLFENYCIEIERVLAKAKDEGKKPGIVIHERSKMRITGVNRPDGRVAKSLTLANDSSSSMQSLSKKIFLRDYPDFVEGKIHDYSDIAPVYASKSTFHGNAVYYFALFQKIREFEQRSKGSLTSAKRELPKNYVLVIDEINRGNVSRIFGELITLLEADKRTSLSQKSGISVRLPYSKNYDTDDYDRFSVPENLYIIGTMNTTDRSTGSIDYAVRRRFAFITLESSADVIAEWCDDNRVATEVKDTALALFAEINGAEGKRSFVKSHKGSDFELQDLMVGHSYFMAKDLDTLRLKMTYEVIPLIKEYIKDGILVAQKDDDEYFRAWASGHPRSPIENTEQTDVQINDI